jgi:hypothetical protein
MKTQMKNGCIHIIRPLIWLLNRGYVFDTENTRKLNNVVPNPHAPYTTLATCGKREYEELIEEQFIELARYMGKFKAISTEDFRIQRDRSLVDEIVSLDLLVQEPVKDFSVLSPSLDIISRAYSPVSHAFARASMLDYDPVRD